MDEHKLIEVTYPGLVTAEMIAGLLTEPLVPSKICGYVGELRVTWNAERLVIEGGNF